MAAYQSVRNSAEGRAKSFCEGKGLSYEPLRERVSVGAHIAGNFPRAEVVFTCLPKQESIDNIGLKPSSPSRYEMFRELKALLDEGIITQDEYEQEKRKILKN